MHYLNETDETLVMLTLAGEQSAYEVLVVRYQKAVISAAMSVTRNYFMAEDAAQDAFVTAWMKLNTLQEMQKFSAWVCRIARNCALNMITRYRSFLPLDTVDNLDIADDAMQNPAEMYALSAERDEVDKSIGKLPEKVRKIICLHYFEGLSIAEIADKMRIAEGTVKWQLHDGRKRIRKDLCAMNEKYSDTLVQRVMKKVEELKLLQVKNDKSGFETVYNNVLCAVEELPESKDKNHALADVLMRGWWWFPGEKNDALFARIREAAISGKNDEVMEFIVTREDSKAYGGDMIDYIRFIRDKQIPMLEKAGFVRALGREWFWLGYHYFRNGQPDQGREAYDHVLKILNSSHAYRALIPGARKMEELLSSDFKDKDNNTYLIGGSADEFRYVDGMLRYWKSEEYGEGYLNSVDREISDIFRFSAICDGCFFDSSLKVGESVTGSDGTTLTFVSDSETVETPAGIFHDCRLWMTKYANWSGISVVKSYYKSGIGIVRFEHSKDSFRDVRVLQSYRILGGSGLLPLAVGNTWEYADQYNPTVMKSSLSFAVTHADEKSVIVASENSIERLKYDENNWLDMIQQIRTEYCTKDDDQKICDVSQTVNRAEALAKTPMEKAHTKAAASVIRRIMDTDPTFNPGYTAVGHWNFFDRNVILKKNNTLTLLRNPRWSFEWKRTCMNAPYPILYNDIYGILQDAAHCIWTDEWRMGASPIVEYSNVKTQINCEDGGTVTTKAGTFQNCLKLSLDIGGMTDGLSYRGGKKVYYFADGVGIVRTENEYCSGARVAVYELTSYDGPGEGYMPLADGMKRRYDALDLTDGFVGAAEYTYVADHDGNIVIFADRTGIRELPPPITQYSTIQREAMEDQLWEEGKDNESRLCHDVNNFYLLCHFFGRPSRYWNAQEKAVAWNKYRLKIMEGLGENGQVPQAWLGHYASTGFRTACSLFGCGKKEEGYLWLDKAFEAYPKWDSIPEGAEMDVGDPLIYGGIKVVKGKGIIKLPDDTIEPINYNHLFDGDCSLMYYGMTAPHGWEWFNPVRDEERFQEYVERARKLTENKS